MNWRLTVPELTFIVGDCSPVVLMHDREFEDAALQLAAACGVRHLHARDSEYERLIASADGKVMPEPLTFDDTAALLYTSGTTGHPKGAVITHGMRFWQTINLTGPERLTADSVTLVTLPQFHVGGLDVYANPVFHFGGKVLVMRGFGQPDTLHLFTDPAVGLTHYIGAPAHYLFMAQLPEFATAVFSPNLLACIAAAPVPLPQLRQWEDRGLPLLQGYGMTETCGVVTMLEPEHRVRKAGSAGKPCLHVAVRLVRVDGTPAGTGEMGELWVKGPSVTPGYWENDAANRTAFADGWLRTGDAAMIDDEGFYYIVDRWKDMYISGGENVYPAEVEEVLLNLTASRRWRSSACRTNAGARSAAPSSPSHLGYRLTEADIMRHCDGKSGTATWQLRGPMHGSSMRCRAMRRARCTSRHCGGCTGEERRTSRPSPSPRWQVATSWTVEAGASVSHKGCAIQILYLELELEDGLDLQRAVRVENHVQTVDKLAQSKGSMILAANPECRGRRQTCDCRVQFSSK